MLSPHFGRQKSPPLNSKNKGMVKTLVPPGTLRMPPNGPPDTIKENTMEASNSPHTMTNQHVSKTRIFQSLDNSRIVNNEDASNE
jgi:hypothetical protein